MTPRIPFPSSVVEVFPRPAPRPHLVRRILIALVGAALLAGAVSVFATTVPTKLGQIGRAGEAASVLAPVAPGATYRWQFNGLDLPGSAGPVFAIDRVQPAHAGLYTPVVTNGGAPTSDPVVFGLASSAKVLGYGVELTANVQHPNGRVYDQILLEGAALTVTADPGQVTRVSFLDLNDDIVQVEFSGAGTLTVLLDNATIHVLPVLYNQNALYTKGHASIVVADADETTNVAVFSIGPMTAVNQALFKLATIYDSVADIAYIGIQSRNGKFGGVRAANTRFYATRGLAGIYAPDVEFTGPVYVHDIHAYDDATSTFIVGSVTGARVAGGDMFQPNGRAVKVGGLAALHYLDGTDSHGVLLPARANRGRLEENGVDVTDKIAFDVHIQPAGGAGR